MPVKIFPFSEIPTAMRYMRGGTDMGKIVISDDKCNDTKILVE